MYDFDAGNLSLNFANTLDWHGSEHPVERLTGYMDLVAWGEQAGLISSDLATHLHAQADKQAGNTVDAYDLALHLREAIYHIFSNRYAGEPICGTGFGNPELHRPRGPGSPAIGSFWG